MSTSQIAATARLGANSRHGHYCVIGDGVRIGDGCIIGHHVIIHEETVIGNNVRIDDGAVIGKRPMRAANSAVTKDGDLPPTIIGNDCIIGTHVVIYRGASISDKVLIADLSTVREQVTIGRKTIVGRGVSIENQCTIGNYVKLETNAYITAYSEIGDRAFVAPCVATSNDNFVGRTKERFRHFKGVIIKRGARIGVHATVLPGKTIGEDALIAAGALVTADTPDRKIVAGVPGKVFRDVPEDQLLDKQDWKDD